MVGAAVFIDRGGGRNRGDGRGHFVQVVDRQADGLGAGVAGRVGGRHVKAVAWRAFEVRVGDQRHVAAGAVDAEGCVRDAQAVAGRMRVGRGGGVDHLVGAAVLIDGGSGRARGEARRCGVMHHCQWGAGGFVACSVYDLADKGIAASRQCYGEGSTCESFRFGVHACVVAKINRRCGAVMVNVQDFAEVQRR